MKNLPLAICNNCGSVFVDTNPSAGQKLHSVNDEVPELAIMTDADGHYIGCPVCKTDAYLMDFEGELNTTK